MPNPGYVYVFFNPSLPGLVKIGRTQRNPAERAAELSAATGVPTPFMLVFDCAFADCESAERHIHDVLSLRGHRRAANREFFEMSVSDAVKTVVAAQRTFPPPAGAVEGPGTDGATDLDDICDFAARLLYGLDDSVQDVRRGLSLYHQAARAGSSRALFALAELWILYSLKDDEFEALRPLIEPLAEKHPEAWGYLAMYWKRNDHMDNAIKCWNRLFAKLEALDRDVAVEWASRFALYTPLERVQDSHRQVLHGFRSSVLELNEKFIAQRHKVELVLFPENFKSEPTTPRTTPRKTPDWDGIESARRQIVEGQLNAEEKQRLFEWVREELRK